jgi:hypothetical protein
MGKMIPLGRNNHVIGFGGISRKVAVNKPSMDSIY